MSDSLARKRLATSAIKRLNLPANLRAKALAFAASDNKTGSSLRDLIELNDDDDLEPAVVSFLEEQTAGQGSGQDIEPLHQALAILLDYTDENKTAISEPGFKHILIQQYGNNISTPVGKAYCQLTHTYLPKKFVIGSHLWKRAWNRWRYMVGIEDINSSRNGLLLFRPIEWTYDNSRAIFVRDPMGNWVYTLLDEGLRNIKLIDKFLELESANANSNDEAQQMRSNLEATLQGLNTFGDLDGRWLTSNTEHNVDPYSRVLYFQARRAIAKGVQDGYVVSEPDITDFASDHSNKDLMMRFLDDSMAFQNT